MQPILTLSGVFSIVGVYLQICKESFNCFKNVRVRLAWTVQKVIGLFKVIPYA